MGKKYDYVIVGSGLFGATFAYEAARKGKKCLILEKRTVPGGNIRCEEKDGINIHLYGAHVFHTKEKTLWDYVNQFSDFNKFINCPMANYRGELYNLPFNMNTFNKIWGVTTPQEAVDKIAREIENYPVEEEPKNLEEQAIRLVGPTIYEKLVKGYTEKQWGRPCNQLPAFIIKRLPVRYVFDNNYFNDRYQGIPVGGYNQIITKLIAGCDVVYNVDYNTKREEYKKIGEKVLYTGMVDALFDYQLGHLEYRSVRFEHSRHETDNYQGVAVMNYTDAETPYTRIIEHKHFEFGEQPVTWISKEYPSDYKDTNEPYYPVNNEVNQILHNRYLKLAHHDKQLLLGGRLAEYKYYDMDQTIKSALQLVTQELG